MVRLAPKYSEDEVKNVLDELASDFGRTPTLKEMCKHLKISSSTWLKRYGKYLSFLHKYGYEGYTKKDHYTKERKIGLAGLRKLCDELHRIPSMQEVNECSYTLSHDRYRVLFFGYLNAVNAVKPNWLERSEHGRLRYSDDFLVSEYFRVKNILGRVPHFIDMKKLSSIHPCIYQERFDTWVQFLSHVGDKPDRSKQFRLNGKRRFKAKDGDICFSKEERRIDNFLFENGIPHEKEYLYPYHPKYNPKGMKRSDWYIDGAYVEYAGMLSFFNSKVRNRYQRKLDEKMNLCLESNLDFLIITPDNFSNMKKELLSFFGG